jgi:8-oxo-dGTP pyrophosphatase MutT (NUDIX family)
MKSLQPAKLRPSSSIIFISSNNDVLMLKRTPASSSYPSAWVFPGGNLSLEQDGTSNDTAHRDSPLYRVSAIRELFEETGILLVKQVEGTSVAVQPKSYTMAESDRKRGRRLVHSGQVRFLEWLQEQGFVPDTGMEILLARCADKRVLTRLKIR